MLWKHNIDREIYTFNDENVEDFIRKSTKGGRVAASNRYLQSKQCEELLKTIEINLKIDNENLTIVDE